MESVKRMVIWAGAVLTVDKEAHVYVPGYVVVVGEKIVEVGKGHPVSLVGDEVIHAEGKLVMPGLVNCHNHTPMVLTRGMCEGVSLFTMDGFLHRLRYFESFIDETFASNTVPLSCAEMIRLGTTCFADQYFYTKNIYEKVEESGLRGVLAYGIVELGDAVRRKNELASCEAFLEEANGGNGRVRGWVGPHAFFVDNSLDLIAEEIALAKKYHCGFHIHFATSNEENDWCIPHYGMRAVPMMEKLGILDVPVLGAHSITVDENDIKILAAHPFNPVLAPSSSMRSGFPAMPAKAMLQAGLNVVLGTDNVCSSNSYDMFGEMGTAGKLMTNREHDVNAITAKELVYMATIKGAKALGLEHEIGSLEVGKKADLIALDLRDPGFIPICGQDWYTQLVYSVSGMSVTDSLVDGKWLMRDRQLLTVDMDEAMQNSENATSELIKRMGGWPKG
mgnify:CR=1 FL=1